MSHVDEGALHAYLDGALDALGTEQATRVREHLASCEQCALRLEDERAWRDEASSVLAGAAPDLGDLPPFEELRARASAQGPRPAGWLMRRIAWAASVMIGLGTGWMLRGVTVPAGAEFDPGLTDIPSAAAPQNDPGARLGQASFADAESADEREAVGDADASIADPPPAVEVLAAEAIPERREQTDLGLADAVLEAPAAVVQVGDSVARAVPGEAARARTVAAEQELKAIELRSGVPVATRAASPLRTEERLDAPMDALRDRPDEGGREKDSMESEPGRLLVPGLPVLSVSWLEAGGLNGAIRVLQQMERGDTLELIHLPPGVDLAGLPPVESDGRTQLVIPRGGGWLVARARLTRPDLEAVIRTVGGDAR